jgi:dimethylaniline monooxygenase (N-oxide forming)
VVHLCWFLVGLTKLVIFVKSTKVQPYFNRRYITYGSLGRWKDGKIDLPRVEQNGHSVEFAPWPERIDDEGIIHFQKNDSLESKYIETVKIKPDVVIYATGYTHMSFPFLGEGYPHSRDANVRSMWKEGDETVAFIGFIRPQLGKHSPWQAPYLVGSLHGTDSYFCLGAIPPLTEFQAQLWILRILNLLPRSNLQHLSPSFDPDAEEWYKLQVGPRARVRHGVDHETYAYQLALDIGSAPSALQVAQHGWKVFVAWAFGANFNTKFRLVGPWKWGGAEEVMEMEIYELITRRAFFWGMLSIPSLVYR